MKTLAEIRAQLAAGQFEFSRHAFRRAIERDISEAEIRQAGQRARIIEDKPMTSMGRVACCLGSPMRGGPCICRFRAPTPS